MLGRLSIALSLFALGPAGQAGVILSPVRVVDSSPTAADCRSPVRPQGHCSPERTIDHSGLKSPFVNGSTNYSSYLSQRPLHDRYTERQEWFTPLGVATGFILYDLGASYTVHRMAFWNPEQEGVARVAVESCTDAACTTKQNLGAFTPTLTPLNIDYGADDLNLADSYTRYIRLTLTAGPAGPQPRIALGEVAFDVTAGQAIPEPGLGPVLMTLLALYAFWKLHIQQRKRLQ